MELEKAVGTRSTGLHILRVIIEVLKGYAGTRHRDDGMALGSTIEKLRCLTIDLHREDTDAYFYESDAYRKLNLVPKMFNWVIGVMESAEVPINGTRKPRPGEQVYIHQALARFVFESLMNASRVRGSHGQMWDVLHNCVWIEVFVQPNEHGSHRAIVQSLIVRQFYKQIMRMDRAGTNYVGVRAVGIILNILGLETSARQNSLPCEKAIYKCSKQWVVENYLQLNDEDPELAKELLVGSLEFDSDTRQIAKVYSGWKKDDEPREFLELEGPFEEGIV